MAQTLTDFLKYSALIYYITKRAHSQLKDTLTPKATAKALKYIDTRFKYVI